MNLSLLNSLCYTLGWFWCVLFGIRGQSIVATIGAVFLILFQLYWTKIKDIALYIQDVLLVIFSVPLGALLEIFFIQTNLIHYANTTKMFPPIWIVFLYPLFSLLLNHSLKIIKKLPSIFSIRFSRCSSELYCGYFVRRINFSIPTSPNLGHDWNLWGLFLCLLVKIANIVEKATAESLCTLSVVGHLNFAAHSFYKERP